MAGWMAAGGLDGGLDGGTDGGTDGGADSGADCGADSGADSGPGNLAGCCWTAVLGWERENENWFELGCLGPLLGGGLGRGSKAFFRLSAALLASLSAIFLLLSLISVATTWGILI